MPNWERQLDATGQHYKSIVLHITKPGKDQNSKLEVWFLSNVYCFKSQKILNRTVVSHGPSVIPNLQVKNQLRRGKWLISSYSLPTVLKDQHDFVIQHWQFLKVLLGTSLSSLHRSFHLLPPLLHCLLNMYLQLRPLL